MDRTLRIDLTRDELEIVIEGLSCLKDLKTDYADRVEETAHKILIDSYGTDFLYR